MKKLDAQSFQLWFACTVARQLNQAPEGVVGLSSLERGIGGTAEMEDDVVVESILNNLGGQARDTVQQLDALDVGREERSVDTPFQAHRNEVVVKKLVQAFKLRLAAGSGTKCNGPAQNFIPTLKLAPLVPMPKSAAPKEKPISAPVQTCWGVCSPAWIRLAPVAIARP